MRCFFSLLTLLVSSITVPAFGESNEAPVVEIVGGDRTVADSDCKNTEYVMVEAIASDTDGEVVSGYWLIGDRVMSSAASTTLLLRDGSTTVTFLATDDDGDSTSKSATISVVAPRSNFSDSVINISCGNRHISDDDGVLGEVFTFEAPQSVEELASSSWFFEDELVASGTSADLELVAGENLVTYRAVNYKGELTSISAVISLSYTAPRLSIRGRSRTITDTDRQPGEVLAVTTSMQNGVAGVVASTSWLVDGEVVANGLSANLTLKDGANEVRLKVTYDDGDSSVTRVFDDGVAQTDDIITIMVAPPNLSEPETTITVKAGSKILTGNDPSQDSASVFITETEMYYGNSINLEASVSHPEGSVISTQWVNYRGDVVSKEASLDITAENKHLYLGPFGLGCWRMAFQAIEGETVTSQEFSVCIIPDPNFDVLLTLADNLSDGAPNVLDTDGKPGEWVGFNLETTDVVRTSSWIINGVSGIQPGYLYYRPKEYRLFLADGTNVVTASRKNLDGVEKTVSVTVTVNAPKEEPNEAPIVSISGGDRKFSSDNIAVTASLSASAVDADGEIKSTSWLIGGKVFATGLSAEILLCRGVTTISFSAEDDEGASSLTSVELTHEGMEGREDPSCNNIVGVLGLGLADSDGLPGEMREVGFIHSRTDIGIGAAPKSTSIWLNGEKISEQSWPPLKHTISLRLPDGDSFVCRQIDDGPIMCSNYPVASTSENNPPTALIFGKRFFRDSFITDTDDLPGETVSLSATAIDSDGSIVSTEWLLDGSVVATGTSSELRLDDGYTDIFFKIIDNDGAVNIARARFRVSEPKTSDNGFYLDSNLLTIKNTAGGVITTIAEATLGSNGVLTTSGAKLPRIDVGDEALTGGLPSFEFTLATDDLDSDTTNTFKIGLSIVDDASPTTRRFEAYISELRIAVAGDGTTVIGTIPDQPMNVIARKGSATFYQAIQNSTDNGPVTISGGRLSFNGERAVELLKAAGNDILDAVIDDFTLSGAFTFRIVMEEISNGGAKVGTISATSFSAIPRISASCALNAASTIGNVFKLTGDAGFSIADQFTNPYVVQGRFSSNQNADNVAAAAFTETCTGSAGGGGGGGGAAPIVEEVTDVAASESEVAELDDVLDDVADTEGPLTEAVQEQVDALNTALATLAEELDTQVDEEIAAGEVSEATVTSSTNVATKSAAATSAITKSLASGGTVSKTSLLGALTSGAKSSATASKVGKATTSAESKAALVTQNKTILTNSATMLTSLANSETELTVEEVDQVKTVARNLVSTSNSLSGSGTSTNDLKEIATQTSVVLQAQAELGIAADTALVEAVSEASESMATSVITQELAVDGAAPTTEQITEALTTNSTLFDNVLEASIPLPPAVIITEVEREDRIAAARPLITPEVQQSILSATKKVVRPDTVVLKSGKSALTTLLDFLTSPAIISAPLLDSRVRNAVALTDETKITSDEATGLVTISSATETYVGMVLGVRSVPAAVPNGIRFRTDGRATVVTEGTAIDIATNSVSLLDFIDLAETTGFSFEQNTNASFTLDLGEGQTFVGAYAYDNLVDADLSSACGALSVIAPVGPLNAASYSYGIECASGVLQRVVPFTANTAFFSSMQASEMTVSVDRNTGIVNVSGIGKLKPSFITAQPTEAELVYHASETDSFGIALQIIDINNDGINDYKVISATGVQIMYGLN